VDRARPRRGLPLFVVVKSENDLFGFRGVLVVLCRQLARVTDSRLM